MPEIKKYDNRKINGINAYLAAFSWDRIDTLKARNGVRSRIEKYRRGRRIAKIAAGLSSAAAVVVFAFVMLSPPQTGNPERIFYERGSTGVTLIGSDGTHYSLDDAAQEIAIGDNGSSIRKEGSILKVVTLPQGRSPQTTDSKPATVTLKIPRGSEYQLVLSDGTKVWLGAESSIVFPERFEAHRRTVSMSGEAYFDVTANPAQPFIVRCGDMDIEVLGTEFNVYAYPDEHFIVTTLLRGSIRQYFDGYDGEVLLYPSQQSSYHKATGNVSIVLIDAEDYTAYLEGKTIFRNTPLEQILASLGRTFDYEFVIVNPAILRDRYTLTLNKREDIEIPLNKLKLTGGITYEKNGKTITVR